MISLIEQRLERTVSEQGAECAKASGFGLGRGVGTNDVWAQEYFDPKDLHCVDRQLFG